MNRQYEQSIRPILDCYDKIRVHLVGTDITIPCICSVGCQSAGKSSVLESITGIQLPRGTGTVTRCPIMIQLRNTKKKETARIKYEYDSNDSWENITIDQIAQKISDYQNELIKKENNPVLSEKSIQLEVNRINAPDLTLYDLPGITHKDDETFEKITKIVTKFLIKEETIAIFVHASTSDFDSNECLSIMRKISNEGKNNIFDRTIPIFSKPDDALKTNPKTLINNLEMGKELGFTYQPILVLNRNQDQIDKNVDGEEIRKLEEELFNSPQLKDYCHTGHGINSLIELLVSIQKDKLISSMSKVKSKVKQRLREYNDELNKLPKACKSRKEFNKYLLKCCDQYDISFQNKLNNVEYIFSKNSNNKKRAENLNYDMQKEEKNEKKTKEEMPINQMLPVKNEKKENFTQEEGINCLETRVRKEFLKFKDKFTKQMYKYLSIDFYDQIEFILRDSIRLKVENFYGEDCWDNIMHQEIKSLFEDCSKLIDDINDKIEKEVSGPFKMAFGESKELYEKAREVLDDFIEENKKKCFDYFSIIKTIECDRNFTINERYMDYVKKIKKKIEDENDEVKNENKMQDYENEYSNSIFSKMAKPPTQNNSNNQNKNNNNLKKQVENDISDEFFYFYTSLDKEKFNKFIQELKTKRKEPKIIEIMCSIFAYLKIFLDRFLDYLYNGILYYLLKGFLHNNFTIHLKNEFSDMDDSTVINLMGNSETVKAIEKIEKKIEELDKAYKELKNL